MNDAWINVLLQNGIAGAVLCWFMFYVTPALRGIQRSIDRLAKAQLIQLADSPSLSVALKRRAKELEEEITTGKDDL